LEALSRAGALEVLVEAGPQLTASILESDLWDEHVLIRQGAAPHAEDEVLVRYRSALAELGREADVLRHC
jgi:diaminohydroxyphosphoribosylaminopyrimidine deaminase/5-amino-6-(5-phosphoribosylamino)uracil reductase